MSRSVVRGSRLRPRKYRPEWLSLFSSYSLFAVRRGCLTGAALLLFQGSLGRKHGCGSECDVGREPDNHVYGHHLRRGVVIKGRNGPRQMWREGRLPRPNIVCYLRTWVGERGTKSCLVVQCAWAVPHREPHTPFTFTIISIRDKGNPYNQKVIRPKKKIPTSTPKNPHAGSQRDPGRALLPTQPPPSPPLPQPL